MGLDLNQLGWLPLVALLCAAFALWLIYDNKTYGGFWKLSRKETQIALVVVIAIALLWWLST